MAASIPDIAAAWVFVDRMGLEEGAELNLLASVGNVYDLKKLQQAAIAQDRALRKPWEGAQSSKGDRGVRKEWWNRRTQQSVNMANLDDLGSIGEIPEEDLPENEPEVVPEEVAEQLYEAYMTHETAKQKYRDSLKLRGSDPEALRQVAADKLQAAKARSFCAGCRRRGHWHKDAICPLNQQKNMGKDGGFDGVRKGG